MSVSLESLMREQPAGEPRLLVVTQLLSFLAIGGGAALSFVAVSAAALSQRSPASSSEPRTRRSASDDLSPAAPSPAFRRGWLVLGLLVPLALLLLWVLRPSPATAPPAPPSVARGVQLTVESEPPGARVAEGNTVYGVTPLQLSLSFSGAAAKPRVFVLELSGYRPYVVEQGPSSGPARVHAVLRRTWSAPDAARAPATEATDREGWYLNAPDGELIALTDAERTLVQRLRQEQGRPVERETLIEALTSNTADFDPHRLEVLIHRLRRKLARTVQPKLEIVTIRGSGYGLLES